MQLRMMEYDTSTAVDATTDEDNNRKDAESAKKDSSSRPLRLRGSIFVLFLFHALDFQQRERS